MAEVQSTYLFEITPEVAKDMLSRNYDKQRSISRLWVSQLASMILDGSYQKDNGGNAIIIDEDGILYDGQHRLLAVIEANKSQVMRINVIDDGEAVFETLDNGRRRTAGSFIGNVEASTARLVYCIERGSAPLASAVSGWAAAHRKPTRLDVTTYYKERREQIDRLTRIGSSMRQTLGKGSAPAFAAFVFVEEWLGEEVGWFVEDFCRDDGQITGPMKFTLLRNKGISTDRAWTIGTLLQAYEILKAGKKTKMLNQQTRYLDKYSKLINKKRSELL